METKTRGFASMDKEKARTLQSKGGRTAQATGRAHRFTSETASKAGLAGGRPRRRDILTVTCSVCKVKLTPIELKQHKC